MGWGAVGNSLSRIDDKGGAYTCAQSSGEKTSKCKGYWIHVEKSAKYKERRNTMDSWRYCSLPKVPGTLQVILFLPLRLEPLCIAVAVFNEIG